MGRARTPEDVPVRVAILVLMLLFTGLLTAPLAAAGTGITVERGETLSQIAARHGVAVADLARVNGIANPDLVRSGRTLVLPRRTAAAPAASAAVAHRVVAGDTLAAISARYGVSVASIARANGIADPNVVVLGARLRIPGSVGGARGVVSPVSTGTSGTHRVASGESLGGIAARYGVTTRALAVANRIANPNLIVAGRTLRLPTAATGLPGPTSTVRPRVNRAPLAAVGKDEVRRLIDLHSDRHGVPRQLSRAIAWQESGFQQTVVSSTGAIGVMQLMPETARWVGRDLLRRPFNPSNVADNVEGGVVFLKWLRQRAANRDQAIAGYYQGLNSVQTRGLYDDTSQYVTSVNALLGRV